MESPPAGESSLFWVYFSVGIILLAVSIYYAVKHASVPGFALLPFLVFIVIYDNMSVGVMLGASSWSAISGVLAVRYALLSFAVPLRLLTSFELAYIVRKKRSSNFFCMTFDQGHRKKEGTCSSLVRYSVWLVSFLLIFIATIANAEYILDPSAKAYTATARFSNKALDSSRFASSFSVSDFTDVVPEALSAAFLLFVGTSLWRYGTAQSMDVSATAVNKWLILNAGTLGLLLAWTLSPTDWVAPYAYNGCEVFLAAAITATAVLVDINLKGLAELSETITADNSKSAHTEIENLPPRFRANSKEAASPAMKGQSADDSSGALPGRSVKSLRATSTMPPLHLTSPSSASRSPGRGGRGSSSSSSGRGRGGGDIGTTNPAAYTVQSPSATTGARRMPPPPPAPHSVRAAALASRSAVTEHEDRAPPTRHPSATMAAADSQDEEQRQRQQPQQRGRRNRSTAAGRGVIASPSTESQGDSEVEVVEDAQVGEFGQLPVAARRPLPPGPRPPNAFVGVNPLHTAVA